jgi:hypothetical protein
MKKICFAKANVFIAWPDDSRYKRGGFSNAENKPLRRQTL